MVAIRGSIQRAVYAVVKEQYLTEPEKPLTILDISDKCPEFKYNSIRVSIQTMVARDILRYEGKKGNAHIVKLGGKQPESRAGNPVPVQKPEFGSIFSDVKSPLPTSQAIQDRKALSAPLSTTIPDEPYNFTYIPPQMSSGITSNPSPVAKAQPSTKTEEPKETKKKPVTVGENYRTGFVDGWMACIRYMDSKVDESG